MAPSAPSIAEIRAAATLLIPFSVRTPVLQLQNHGSSCEIFLKLENLQTIGAFKVRPVGNVMLNADPATLKEGVYTASTGNAGIAVAWMATKLGISSTVYAPKAAPKEKLEMIRAFGARVVILSEENWWRVIKDSHHPNDPGLYVDAVRDPLAIAGNGTIGLEIMEQLPDVETIVLPFGGGGLTSGVATAVKALKPDTRIVVAESATSTPVTAALRAGRPVSVPMEPTFISGAGAESVLDEMWPLVNELIDETCVIAVASVAGSIRRLFESQKVIAEGAGAIALAAALANKSEYGRTVCIISGGNIGAELMAQILQDAAV